MSESYPSPERNLWRKTDGQLVKTMLMRLHELRNVFERDEQSSVLGRRARDTRPTSFLEVYREKPKRNVQIFHIHVLATCADVDREVYTKRLAGLEGNSARSSGHRPLPFCPRDVN